LLANESEYAADDKINLSRVPFIYRYAARRENGAFYNCHTYLLPSHQREFFGIAIWLRRRLAKKPFNNKEYCIWREYMMMVKEDM
jgi:hypothetical protein